LSSSFLARALGDSQTIGIDIGHYSIKLVRVQHSHKGTHVVMTADLEPLPEGVVVDCNIQDAEKLHDALAKLFARNMLDLEQADYVISINGAAGVLVDQMTVKVPKNAKEDAFILQMAQAKPPFDDPDNALDYHIVSRNKDEVNIVVVAIKSVQLDNWARFFETLDKKLSCIDIACFGMANAYAATIEPDQAEQTVALFNIGEKKMNAVFLKDGYFHSFRTMTGGSLESVAGMLASHLNIDVEKCHEIFLTGDTGCVDGFSEAEVEAALKMAYEEIVSAVEFGIRYFSSHEGGDSKPAKILLAGGGACLPNLCDYVSERIGIETSTVNPFRAVTCDPAVLGENGISLALSNIYASALGLAMRRF